MSERVGDEFDRLNKAFDKLLANCKVTSFTTNKPDNMKFLIEYGLTYDEAKAWLEQEPNYVPIRRKKNSSRIRRRRNRT